MLVSLQILTLQTQPSGQEEAWEVLQESHLEKNRGPPHAALAELSQKSALIVWVNHHKSGPLTPLSSHLS